MVIFLNIVDDVYDTIPSPREKIAKPIEKHYSASRASEQ